jgi:VIT1/CCC1 family predicted Fe2+/Mn2+ transporter
LPNPDKRVRLEPEDFAGAFAVFLLVFVFTLPVVVPFIFVQDAQIALRVSNAIAVAMMLLCGYAFGRLAGYRPWLTAASMVLLGCLLVGLAIALGG